MAMLLIVPWRLAGAEPDADPSGHWQGTVQVPDKPVAIEVDLAKNARGELIGTFDNPSEGAKGLPLAKIAVAGREVRFAITARGGGAFRATLRGDGQAMTGEFTLAQGGQQLAFQLARSGDARIAPPPPRSRAISKQLAGSWTGTLAVDGKQLVVGLTLANQPDGSATGTITSDGLELPVAVAQSGAQVRIEVPSVSGTYVGELKAGAQLVGTWRQRSQSLPLTFQRASK